MEEEELNVAHGVFYHVQTTARWVKTHEGGSGLQQFCGS